MSGAGVVVADTTPLNYLILIGESDVLLRLFGEIPSLHDRLDSNP
jgi:hypothetical protein